jgi:MazG family protein
MKGLADLVRTLRGENGCPWDKKQTPATIGRYLIEEVYELADTIESGDADAICEELGDVLFLVFFLTRLYEEAGQFDMTDVTRKNIAKMVRRHPHVFGESQARTTEEIRTQWHRIKKQEKKENPSISVLDSIPVGLPALMRAYRISERAAATGFDWHNLSEVLLKVEEEWGELKEALNRAGTENMDDVMLEFGDLIFTLTNVARFARFHPETATTAAIRKFNRRFQWMEQAADAQGRNLEDIGRAEMEQLWETAKQQE